MRAIQASIFALSSFTENNTNLFRSLVTALIACHFCCSLWYIGVLFAASSSTRSCKVRPVWKSTSASGAPDNSALSHVSAMTRPCRLRRAVTNRHRHASSRRRVDGVAGDGRRRRRPPTARDRCPKTHQRRRRDAGSPPTAPHHHTARNPTALRLSPVLSRQVPTAVRTHSNSKKKTPSAIILRNDLRRCPDDGVKAPER